MAEIVRVVRLLEEVRIEDAEASTSEHADDVLDKHAVQAREVGPGRHVLEFERGHMLHLLAGLAVERAHARESAMVSPVAAEKVRRDALLEPVVVVVAPLVEHPCHGRDEMIRGEDNAKTAHSRDVPATPRPRRGIPSALWRARRRCTREAW